MITLNPTLATLLQAVPKDHERSDWYAAMDSFMTAFGKEYGQFLETVPVARNSGCVENCPTQFKAVLRAMVTQGVRLGYTDSSDYIYLQHSDKGIFELYFAEAEGMVSYNVHQSEYFPQCYPLLALRSALMRHSSEHPLRATVKGMSEALAITINKLDMENAA